MPHHQAIVDIFFNEVKDMNCKYCGKECKNTNSLTQHEIRCKQNPDKIEIKSNIVTYFNNTGRPAWNKGLTAETDSRIAASVNKLRDEFASKHHTELSSKLDDDGKLYQKWSYRKSRNKTVKNKFLLSFDEFCILLDRAGIKSSDLGYKGNKYDLARYGDSGDYTFDNCRFITHQENVKERRVSEKMIKSALKAASARRGKKTNFSEEGKARLEAYRTKIHEEYERREEERRSKLDPRWCGEHNSSYGSHWITDGVNSRKWRPDQEPEIPEGWRLGRVIK